MGLPSTIGFLGVRPNTRAASAARSCWETGAAVGVTRIPVAPDSDASARARAKSGRYVNAWGVCLRKSARGALPAASLSKTSEWATEPEPWAQPGP